MYHILRTQVNALSDLTPSLADLINQWFWSWGLVKKLLLVLGIIILTCYRLHMPVLLLWCLSPMQPDRGQTSHLHAVKTHADPSGHTAEEEACDIVRASHKGRSVGGGHSEDMTIDWTVSWTEATGGSLNPPIPGMYVLTTVPHSGSHFRDAALIAQGIVRPPGVNTWLNTI